MGADARERITHRSAIRAAILAYCKVHGIKRGIYLAAEQIGMSERAARHAYEDGAFAADAERAARADRARLALVTEQIVRLCAEADEITQRGRMNVDMDRPSLDSGGGILRAASNGGFQAREAVTP
jgi:hypothetical protein